MGFCVGEFLGEMLDVLKDENSLRKIFEKNAILRFGKIDRAWVVLSKYTALWYNTHLF